MAKVAGQVGLRAKRREARDASWFVCGMTHICFTPVHNLVFVGQDFVSMAARNREG